MGKSCSITAALCFAYHIHSSRPFLSSPSSTGSSDHSVWLASLGVVRSRYQIHGWSRRVWNRTLKAATSSEEVAQREKARQSKIKAKEQLVSRRVSTRRQLTVQY